MEDAFPVGKPAKLNEEDKKKGWREPGEIPKAESEFLKKRSEHRRECDESRTPFCERCAGMEFERKKRDLELKKEGVAEGDDPSVLLDASLSVDFNKYTGEKYFGKPIGETVTYDTIMQDGRRVKIPIKHRDYKCPRGHRFSLDIRNESQEKKEGKEKGNK